MLQALTTDDFAAWLTALDDAAAEEAATAIEVVAELGVERAAPNSRESLLWYEHPSAARFTRQEWLAWYLEDWAPFFEYAHRVVAQLEAPRFVSRLVRLGPKETATVIEAVERIKRVAGLRLRWVSPGAPPRAAPAERPAERCAEVRRWYLAALAAAGLEVVDVPAHTTALREIALRSIEPGLRLLYGVDARREVALFVLGERLDRSFYGASVRRAEHLWSQFLDGDLRAAPAAPPR